MQPLIVVILAGYLVTLASSLALDPRRMLGIWKLRRETGNSNQDQQDTRAQLQRILDDQPFGGDGILLQLNPDGSFRQCDEGYTEGRWLSGRWRLDARRRTLVIAMNRQYFGPQFDVLLEGIIEEGDSHLNIQRGQVYKGKFVYPKNHPAFFEQPFLDRQALGPFSLQQALATSSVFPQDTEQQPATRWRPSDLYGRRFYMTVEPIPARQYCGGGGVDLVPSPPVDIGSMLIQFFHNDTFQTNAINRTQRGRFRITAEEQIAFDGSGEQGMGLAHEGKWSYLGNIAERNGRLYVTGYVVLGSYRGADARPESVGTFLLTETQDGQSPLDDDESSRDSSFE